MSGWKSFEIDVSQLTQDEIEVLHAQLLSLDIVSINETDVSQHIAYIENPSASTMQNIADLLTQTNLKWNSRTVEEENWTTKWFDNWQPLPIEMLVLIPVQDDQVVSIPQEFSNSIKLYFKPGLGFGTGHHPTTYMLLSTLQDPGLPLADFKNILDLGCGSGILALAAAKLCSANIDALDIDHLALNNARENCELNNIKHINISDTDVKKLSGSYQLIFANLYAELLVEYALELRRLLDHKGHILVSGILENLWEQVLAAFESCQFTLLKKINSPSAMPNYQSDSKWVAAWFTNEG